VGGVVPRIRWSNSIHSCVIPTSSLPDMSLFLCSYLPMTKPPTCFSNWMCLLEYNDVTEEKVQQTVLVGDRTPLVSSCRLPPSPPPAKMVPWSWKCSCAHSGISKHLLLSSI
jgi:hypothetical protein